MPENKEQNFVQTIPVNLERLRLIKINNMNGRTHVVGTNSAEIKIWGNTRGNFTPKVEARNDGREVEIKVGSGGFKVFVDYDSEREEPFDFQFEDYFEEPEFPEFEVEAPEPDDFPETKEGREAYFQAREQYLRTRDEFRHTRDQARAEYRRTRDQVREQSREQRRHQREEMREQARRAKEQAREEARRFKERFKERGGWERFVQLGVDTETFTNLASTIAENVGRAFDELGTLFIEVPAGVELEVKSVSGKIEVYAMKNFCRVNNTSGSILLHDLSGGAQIKGMSGKIEGFNLSGKLALTTTSGTVALANCKLTALDLSTISSSMDLETALIKPDEGDYKINTTSGRIRLRMPLDTRASVECRTLSGRIVVSPEISNVERKNRPGQGLLRSEINGGGRRVTLNSISGKIEVGLYDPANPHPSIGDYWNMPVPPVPPIPPVPPVPPIAVKINTSKLQELARQLVARIRQSMDFQVTRSEDVTRREIALRFWDNYVQMKINLPDDEQRRLFDKVVDILLGSKEEAQGVKIEEVDDEPTAAAATSQEQAEPQILVDPPTAARIWSETKVEDKPAEAALAEQTAVAVASPKRKMSQLEILEAIQRGEISVEEGMQRLAEAEG